MFAFLALAAVPPISQASIDLSKVQVIDRTGTVRRSDLIRPSNGSKAAITVRGDGITVDFNNAVLRGTPSTTDPDQRTGIGIEVIGRNVTIKNARVHGYKVGLIARDADGLKILDSDFSYNWKQRLKSTPEKEDTADWMSFHQNEKDEWLRFGAGIYLSGTDRFEIKGNRIVGGQCGLMITRANDGLIWNNDFSFLSAIGVGMYRASRNRIMHNKIDWAVRGYSHGVYNRGQDSAGILIYEQANNNTFAYNSVTHGGDGFFLWAGQTTMDNGKGGCNDNLLYGNDFSHAPTNGIEATFSRNNFVNNLLLECWHGIWGGYSYESLTLGNVFGQNGQAIAWEHGQKNLIAGNKFLRDNEGIRLWSNASQDPNWGYPKNRDTRSIDWAIVNNTFEGTTTDAIDISRTENVRIEDNTFTKVGSVLKLTADAKGVRTLQNKTRTAGDPGVPDTQRFAFDIQMDKEKYAVPTPWMRESGNVILGLDPKNSDYIKRFDVGWQPLKQYKRGLVIKGGEGMPQIAAVQPLAGGMDPFIKPGEMRGRRFIIVDEWGPYDFQRPMLRLKPGSRNGDRVTFDVLGPKGKWRAVNVTGAQLSSKEGNVPGEVTATLSNAKAGDVRVQMEYVGEKTVDYRGIASPKGAKVAFEWREFRAPIDWNVTFYPWNKDTQDPRQNELWRQNAAVKTVKLDRLDFAGRFVDGVGPNHFATVAEGEIDLPAGDYTLEVTTDDGLRLYVDGKVAIDSWKYQAPTVYTTKLSGGKHKLKVEHFQIDGYAALQVRVRPN